MLGVVWPVSNETSSDESEVRLDQRDPWDPSRLSLVGQVK